MKCPLCGADRLTFTLYDLSPGAWTSVECVTLELAQKRTLRPGVGLCSFTGFVVRLEDTKLALACELCKKPASLISSGRCYCTECSQYVQPQSSLRPIW